MLNFIYEYYILIGCLYLFHCNYLIDAIKTHDFDSIDRVGIFPFNAGKNYPTAPPKFSHPPWVLPYDTQKPPNMPFMRPHSNYNPIHLNMDLRNQLNEPVKPLGKVSKLPMSNDLNPNGVPPGVHLFGNTPYGAFSGSPNGQQFPQFIEEFDDNSEYRRHDLNPIQLPSSSIG